MLAQEIPAIWRQSLTCGKYQGFWINNGGTFAGENFCRLRPNRNGSRTALRFGLIEVPVVHRLDYGEAGLHEGARLDWLLDPKNVSVMLNMIARAARTVSKGEIIRLAGVMAKGA